MDGIERIERRLKLHDVRVLMSVVQAGSMHKAAERLAISQPAVSRAIADLEHALGVRLLDRSPTGIEPTQYGRAIIKRGLAVFDELRQGVKDIEFLADPTAGELRIGCPELIAGGPVLAVIDRLTRRHPRMTFDVVTSPTATSYRELRERRVELAELVNEPWTLPPPDSYIGALAAQAFRAQELKLPRSAVTTASLDMRKRLVATGRFLTMLPSYSVTLHGKPSLKPLPVALSETHGTIAIVTLRN